MRIASAGLALLLTACAGGIVPPAPPRLPNAPPVVIAPRPAPVAPTRVPAIKPPATLAATPNARSAGITPGPDFPSLAVTDEAARRALTAFRLSCPALQRRADVSGLTQSSDWTPACSAAATATDAKAFFAAQFETVRIGTGQAFATGYYEPEIAGSRTRDAANQVPVYGKPADLIELDLGKFRDNLKGRSIVGRFAIPEGFIPYFDRTEIEGGALTGLGLEIAWAADPIEFFFLQVQVRDGCGCPTAP